MNLFKVVMNAVLKEKDDENICEECNQNRSDCVENDDCSCNTNCEQCSVCPPGPRGPQGPTGPSSFDLAEIGTY